MAVIACVACKKADAPAAKGSAGSGSATVASADGAAASDAVTVAVADAAAPLPAFCLDDDDVDASLTIIASDTKSVMFCFGRREGFSSVTGAPAPARTKCAIADFAAATITAVPEKPTPLAPVKPPYDVSRLELLAAMIVVLSAYLGYQGYRQSYPFNTFYNSVYEDYDRLKQIVVNDASSKGIPPEDIIILAREPWDINAATRLKAIMIPNNDLETIYAVADNYGAQYILLPAPRRALDAIYAGSAPDPRFLFVAAVPGTDWKIFQIQTTPRSSRRRMDGSTRTII